MARRGTRCRCQSRAAPDESARLRVARRRRVIPTHEELHDRSSHAQRTLGAPRHTGARDEHRKRRTGSAREESVVVDIANEHSIAYGCAKAFRELSAENFAITYLTRKFALRGAVGARTRSAVSLPLDVCSEGALEGVFAAVAAQWCASTSSSTRSHSPPRRTCRAASSTVPRRGSRRQWMSPATRSCAWPDSPHR